jgi:hypothetical protein
MQGLHTTAQDAGICCYVLYLHAGNTETLDESLCAAGAQQFHALSVQSAENLVKTVLVEYANQSALDLLCLCHFAIYFIVIFLYIKDVCKDTSFLSNYGQVYTFIYIFASTITNKDKK